MLLWERAGVISSRGHQILPARQRNISFLTNEERVVFAGLTRTGTIRGYRAIQREKAHMIESVFGRSKGQSLMEYALLFVLIAVVVIAILVYLGPQLASQYKIISNAL